MNEETAAQFVHSVVKSLQALCHGYVEFGQSVEIIGHLYLNVDKRKKYNYIVQEQVCKSETEGSIVFISNSYHAATPGKKVVPKQQESSHTASELKLHGNKKSVDYIPYNEQGPSQEVSHSVSDGDDLSSISVAATSHDVQPMYSSTPQSDNVYHRKRNHSGGLNREQGDFLSVRSGSVGETAKQFNKGELFPNELTSHSGSSFSPKAAQRISSNIERALNSGNFSKNENTSLGYSGVADNEKTRHLIASVPEDFSNNISHDHNVLPADVQSSDIIRPHQRMSLGAVSKTVTNESRKRFLKDHCFSAVRHRAYTSDNDFNVDLSCVKKETDVTAAASSCEERIVYHDQRSWNKTNIGDPQDSSSYSGEDECKMDSGTDDDNVIPSQDLTPQSTPYPLALHPNTGAPGYGGPVFPQNFADNSLDQTSTLSSDNDTVATSSSLNISGCIPTSSGFSRGPFNNPSAPRPGKVSAEVASKYNMLELAQCRGVYVYPLQITRARNKLSPTACANYLLNCFYTTNELLGSNLTGVNNKKLLDPQIINSILEFTIRTYPGADSVMLKRAIRNKITAAESRVKKKAIMAISRTSST
ncbi:uncharacterized protein LOC121384193 [Gigantopelta aegis]|uniref:uncharacterized protein LOC121384193 n=1 Tax=Gigantopelta aegis TaxID=1735272 RepID=UPI001B88ADD3|nr:uncharacterized protein LOC121384193 [Gigantopelta aegis]XP_041370400.1 uncharacterized protein LOC121384193 [Gigantopelta aegis]XP_041370401.1 uncharacterized protein LOC121384193 [Gigantopelta aegis]